jgi:oligopeptide transport system substrate-binding protein
VFGQAEAVDYDSQTVTIAMTQEPPSLDTSRTTDLVSFFILGHINEGLIRYDQRGRLSPGVAESWQVTDTGITFNLRQDARWSDGSGVIAEDFVYAWRHIVDPANAAPYASILYPILNAEAIQRGHKSAESLGVTAVSDHVLQVTLEKPCGYCLGLMTHVTFFPIKAEFHQRQGERYAAEADTLLFNGPFQLQSWTHGTRLRLSRNPLYWNRDAIKLNRIEVAYITEDNRARLNLFRDDAIAFARLGADTVSEAVSQGLRLRTFVSGGISYLWFNHRKDRITKYLGVRRAVQSVFDSDEYVNRIVTIPGYRSTHTFFPSWLQGIEQRFVEEHPVVPPNIDQQQARGYLLDALEQAGHESAALTLLTVSSPTGVRVAEYLQGLLQQSLGIDVKVDQQTFKQYLQKSRAGDFDLALSSWFPDFDDIVTFADLLGSHNANNRGRYINADYDRILGLLQGGSDPTQRMAAAAELQRIIVTDVPVLPMAETGSTYLQHPRLKGVVRRVMGADPDFTFARVVQ